MKLIRSVRISGFRSIKNQPLEDLGELSALVGKNSSGKSNVLRALNLFFNNEVDPHKPLLFSRDHSQLRARSRVKKQIKISLDFELPSSIRFRKELRHLEQLGPRFAVSRTWELDNRRLALRRSSLTIDSNPVGDSETLADQFLSVIAFRYIPNRSVPAELLKHESQSLADALFQRMKGDKHGVKLLESLSAASSRLLVSATKSMNATGAPLAQPGLATADSIGEMIRMTGFQALGQHGAPVQDEDWGAGHQSFFMYQVLHVLDTNYARFFGWRQATIWGVEEPEAALHRDLETRLVDCLRTWAQDEKSRLQIIQTTHSSVATMGSDKGFFVELKDGESVFTPTAIPTLTRASQEKGVSGWVHPVLSFPWHPVVICEGPSDVRILSHVAQLCGTLHLRFVSLPQLDQTEEGGGKDAIIKYLKRMKSLIRNRPKEAPIVVVFDWDVSQQDFDRARKELNDGTASRDRIVRMNVLHAPPELGPDFSGIERFLPVSLIQEAVMAGEIAIATPPRGPYSVSKSQLSKAKNRLCDRLLMVTDLAQLAPLVEVIKEIEAASR